jgi:predicted metal-dependent hydrolase
LVKLKGKYFEVTTPEHINGKKKQDILKRALWRWYRRHAEKRIGDLVKFYSKRLHIETPSFKVKYQAKRWGSCSNDNGLNINLRIIMAPMSQVEYVVAHELCHQKYKNHSAEFWQLLRLVMPDYEIRKDNLKRDGRMYTK